MRGRLSGFPRWHRACGRHAADAMLGRTIEPMSDLSAFQIANTAIHFSLALVWAIVAHNAWRFLHAQRPHSRFFRMLPLVAATVAFTYGVFTLTTLIPVELQERRP